MASQNQNEFRAKRRGVMVRKDLLSKCNKLAAQQQLSTGDRTSMTAIIEGILEKHFNVPATKKS